MAFHNDDDDEIDSDEAFEDGEEELYREKGFTFKDSENTASGSRQTISEIGGSSHDGGEGYESITGESDESSPDIEPDELQIDDDSNSEVQSMEDDDTGASMTTESEDEPDQGPNSDAIRAMTATVQSNAVSGLLES